MARLAQHPVAAGPLLLLLLSLALVAPSATAACTAEFGGEFQDCKQVDPGLKIYWRTRAGDTDIDLLLEGKPPANGYLGIVLFQTSFVDADLTIAFPLSGTVADLQTYRLDGTSAKLISPQYILSRVGRVGDDGMVRGLIDVNLGGRAVPRDMAVAWVIGNNRAPASLFYKDNPKNGTATLGLKKHEDEVEEAESEADEDEEEEAPEAEEEKEPATEEEEKEPETADKEPAAAEEDDEDTADKEPVEAPAGSGSDDEAGEDGETDSSTSDEEGGGDDNEDEDDEDGETEPETGSEEDEEGGEETPEPSPLICVGAEHLEHLPADSLVFPAHRQSTALCDRHGSCATPGHIVEWRGVPMTMRTYCIAHHDDACEATAMLVNSPKMQRGLRVPSKTDGLQFTPLSASYGTWLEEVLLRAFVRVTGM